MSIDSTQKFAFLFFSDIVGYSQMAANDESHALNLLDEHDIILNRCIADHNGIIIKHIGDAIFAEFPRSTDAINASIKIQKQLKHKNDISPKTDQIFIRIGLHAGQVTEKNSDLFGNEVNLCSRIEGTALPGAIACSPEIMDGQDDQFTRSCGFVKLKNIPKAHQIFRLYCNENEYRSQSNQELNNALLNQGVMIVESDDIPLAYQTLAFIYPDNLGDSKYEFFCYEFFKKLIDDSNKIELLRAPSLNEMIQYKQSGNDISKISTDLSAEYISHLTIHPTQNKFKVNVEITSMNTLKKIYDKSFSGEINQTREVSGKIILDISQNLGLEITDDLRKIFHQKIEVDNNAYLLYLKGKNYSEHISVSKDLERSKKVLKDAIKIDDNFPEAYAALGNTHKLLGEYEDAEEMLEYALDLAEDSNDPETLSLVDNYLGILYKATGNIKKSINFFEKALKYQQNVNDRYMQAHIYNNISQCYSTLGDNDLAINLIVRAKTIYIDFENNEKLGMSYGMLGNIYKDQGDIEKSIESYDKAKSIFFKEKMYFNYAQALILESESCLLLNKNDEAWKNLNESMKYAKSFDNPIMNGKIAFMMGQTHYNKSELNESLDYINESIEIYNDLNNKLMLSRAHVIKTDILIQKKQISSAEKSLEKTKKYSRRLNLQSLNEKIALLEKRIKDNH